MEPVDRLRPIGLAVIAAVRFAESRQSARRGRNQLRIATGVGMLAGAGFCLTKLIDPPVTTFDFWSWFYVGSILITARTAVWLFLTIEGGDE